MKPEKNDEINLTLGSKYRILSLGNRDNMLESRGTFKGVVSLGTVDGIALTLDDREPEYAGKMRVIPTHMLLAVDILEQAADKDEKKASEDHIHYG